MFQMTFAIITPALIIGAAGGAICLYVTVFVKQRLVIDDSLDVFAVHGVGGMLGSLLVALFAVPALGGVGLAGGVGWMQQLGTQALVVAAVAAWSAFVTFVLVKAIGSVTQLRVGAQEEFDGLDLSTHGERAYEYEG
jgi:Amt family ammonium transporter